MTRSKAGNGAVARVLVLIISAVALAILTVGQSSDLESVWSASDRAMIQARIRKQYARRAPIPPAFRSTSNLQRRRRRDGAVWFQRRRQNADARFHRRLRAPRRRPHPAGRSDPVRRRRGRASAAASAPLRLRLPELRAVSAHDAARRIWSSRSSAAAPGAASQGERDARKIPPGRCRRPPPLSAFRRPETALLHRARVDRCAARAAAGRAGARPGCAAAGRACTRCCGRCARSLESRSCWSRTISKNASSWPTK